MGNVRLLKECIENSISKNLSEFEWDDFFDLWFRENGFPSYFVFRRHLGVTNAQYSELFALVDRHHECPQGGGALSYHTTDHFRALLLEGVNAILDSSKDSRAENILKFCKRYDALLSSSVVVDTFFCSCAIFFPKGITLDLSKVAADSGYIHSAGRSVFVRNYAKSRKHHLDGNLRRFLGAISKDELPVPFAVYSHEDFSGYDKESKELINRGIDEMKLYVDKLSMRLKGRLKGQTNNEETLLRLRGGGG